MHPATRARSRRRRRARGRDLRREHRDLHAHALGARPHPRRAAPARAGRPQDDERHRVALRPRTTAASLAPGKPRRRQRHRPRRAHAAPPGDGLRPARRRAAPAADAPTATTPRSSRGEVVMRDGVDTGARPGKTRSAARAGGFGHEPGVSGRQPHGRSRARRTSSSALWDDLIAHIQANEPGCRALHAPPVDDRAERLLRHRALRRPGRVRRAHVVTGVRCLRRLARRRRRGWRDADPHAGEERKG